MISQLIANWHHICGKKNQNPEQLDQPLTKFQFFTLNIFYCDKNKTKIQDTSCKLIKSSPGLLNLAHRENQL
jgi:hypothetical protein